MTPRPAGLPADPDHYTDAQAIAEAIRILRNSGGERYGAGYSWELADRLEKIGHKA